MALGRGATPRLRARTPPDPGSDICKMAETVTSVFGGACRMRLELDEFEEAGADRMLAHFTRRDMTGINWPNTRTREPSERPAAGASDER